MLAEKGKSILCSIVIHCTLLISSNCFCRLSNLTGFGVISKKLGNEKLGNEKLCNEKLGNEKLGNEKLGNEKLGNVRKCYFEIVC